MKTSHSTVSTSIFQIFHLNTRSVRKHYAELDALIAGLESPPCSICLTETWLNDNDDPNMFKLKNYRYCISKPRSGRGGGIMVQMNHEVTLIEQLDCKLDESLLLNVRIKKQNLVLLIIYSPPRADKIAFVELLDHVLEHLSTEYEQVIVCGDFNINTLKNDMLQSNCRNTIKANGFDMYINTPTRISETTQSCIDHFFAYNVKVDCAHVLAHQSFSDHYPITLDFKLHNFPTDHDPIKIRKCNFLKFEPKVTSFLTNLSCAMNNARIF